MLTHKVLVQSERRPRPQKALWFIFHRADSFVDGAEDLHKPPSPIGGAKGFVALLQT